VIDVMPTILEAAGISAPEYVEGVKQAPIERVSMVYTFDETKADAPTRQLTQYFEMIGQRGIYLAKGAMPPYLARDFRITADIDVPPGGAEGMLITEGGRFNGWGLYLLKGKPVFTYNFLNLRRYRWEGAQPLAPGRHRVEFDFDYDGPGLGKGGTGVLTVDGSEAAKQRIPCTVPAVETLDEWMNVGYDTRTGVDDGDYQPPFRFTGTIDKITFKPGPPEMTAEQMKQAVEMNARGRD
jgi:hypothetical protein